MTEITASSNSIEIKMDSGEEILSTDVSATCIYYPPLNEYETNLHRGSTLTIFVKGSTNGLWSQFVNTNNPVTINSVVYTDSKLAYLAVISNI